MVGDEEQEEAEDMLIPLPNVALRELERVVAFCEHHSAEAPRPIPKPLPDGNLASYVSEWDFAFIDLQTNQEIFDLIMAAHYMDIQPLMELGAAKIASMIRGKTAEEIRELFNIENDFTPEEEARIREENRWCEDL
jgi:S-phase kinase-associated protein 1